MKALAPPDDFLSIPRREVLDGLKREGWRFQPKEIGVPSRYSRPIVTTVMDIFSPEGIKLRIGKTPELWERYKEARARVIQKLDNPKPKTV